MSILSYEKVIELCNVLEHDLGLLDAGQSGGIEEARERCRVALRAMSDYKTLFYQVKEYEESARKAEINLERGIIQAREQFQKELSSYIASAKTFVQEMENARKRY